jgi:6-bladed beta-propeller
MNLKKLTMVVIIIFLSFYCSSDHKSKRENLLDFNSIKIIENDTSLLREVGKLKNAIKLETIQNSLLGSISLVKVDPKTKDFLVADCDSGNRLLRFNPVGKYITRYGAIGEGPGEYKRLKSFSIADNGDIIIIASHKIIRFSKSGELLKEARLDCNATGIEIVNNFIYIYPIRYKIDKGRKKTISILNPFFVKIGGIGDFDVRLDKYIFTFSMHMAKMGSNLYFITEYDFSLNIYNTVTQTLSRLVLPNNNSQLDSIWNKDNFNEDDRREVKNKIHRFDSIFAFNDRLLLSEFCREKNHHNLWLFDLKKKIAKIFPLACFYGNFKEKVQKDLFFDLIPGSYENGIIGVFDDVEEFNLHKHKYPILKDIQFKADDNPILAFFEFNQ